MAMTKCKVCKRGVIVNVETVNHVVDSYMVKGEVYKCTCCNDVSIQTRVYQHVTNVRVRREDEVARTAGGL